MKGRDDFGRFINSHKSLFLFIFLFFLILLSTISFAVSIGRFEEDWSVNIIEQEFDNAGFGPRNKDPDGIPDVDVSVTSMNSAFLEIFVNDTVKNAGAYKWSSSSAIYITLSGENVRIRVDNDKSTFYVFENERWLISGIEYNKLYNGTSLINRNTSGVHIETFNDSNSFTIIRTTPYRNGAEITDTYFFEGNNQNKERFPVYHIVQIINGKDLIYEYSVTDLVYNGTTRDAFSPESFGRNMKVTWQEGSYWSKLYQSGILKVRYLIDSSDKNISVRLYDPSTTVQLLGNSTNKFYTSGARTAPKTPSIATIEYTDAQYNSTNVSDTNNYDFYQASSSSYRFRYSRWTFNLSSIMSSGTINWIRICHRGYWYNDQDTGFGQHSFFFYNNTSSLWTINGSYAFNSDSFVCTNFTNPSDVITENKTFMYGETVYAEVGEGQTYTHAYHNFINLTVDYTISAGDSTLPTYSLNSTNSTLAGTPIEFRLKWADAFGLSKAITGLWNGTSWVNYSVGGVQTWCSLSGTSSWCNQTLVVNETVQQLWWKQYANDTTNNWNTSENFSLVTTSAGVTTWLINITSSGAYSDKLGFVGTFYKDASQSGSFGDSKSAFKRVEQSVTSSSAYDNIMERLSSFYKSLTISGIYSEKLVFATAFFKSLTSSTVYADTITKVSSFYIFMISSTMYTDLVSKLASFYRYITSFGTYSESKTIAGYNMAIWIDGVKTNTIQNVSQPTNITLKVSEGLTAVDGAIIELIETDGANVFSVPQIGSTSFGKGNLTTDANGIASLTIISTAYSAPSTYNITVNVYDSNNVLQLTSYLNVQTTDLLSPSFTINVPNKNDVSNTLTKLGNVIAMSRNWINNQKGLNISVNISNTKTITTTNSTMSVNIPTSFTLFGYNEVATNGIIFTFYERSGNLMFVVPQTGVTSMGMGNVTTNSTGYAVMAVIPTGYSAASDYNVSLSAYNETDGSLLNTTYFSINTGTTNDYYTSSQSIINVNDVSNTITKASNVLSNSRGWINA